MEYYLIRRKSDHKYVRIDRYTGSVIVVNWQDATKFTDLENARKNTWEHDEIVCIDTETEQISVIE